MGSRRVSPVPPFAWLLLLAVWGGSDALRFGSLLDLRWTASCRGCEGRNTRLKAVMDADAAAVPIALPPSSLFLRRKDCEVYVIGCLHGAPSSGDDVTIIIGAARPAACVLELCERRYVTVQRELARRGGEADTSRSIISKWWRGIAATQQQHGMVQAALAGVLSLAYVAQKLSKFDPGLEFKAAVRAADALDNGCSLVLGDRDVYETLGRLSGRNGASASAAAAAVSSGDLSPALGGRGRLAALGEALLDDVGVVRRAIFGAPGLSWPLALNVPAALASRPKVVKELAGLLGPPTLFVCAVSEAFQLAWDGLTAPSAGAASAALAAASADAAMLPTVVAAAEDGLALALLAGSSIMMLRFFRLVIGERDAYLARAVATACDENPGAAVVAVVGLLHCNGVAQLLREDGTM